MIQLNRSQNTNTNAIFPDVKPPTGTQQVLINLTQSINNNVTEKVLADVLNNINDLNSWLVLQITGSSVPSSSGQYYANIYTFSYAPPLGTWAEQNTKFGLTANLWGGSGSGDYVLGTLLSTERAYVSGSDQYDITQYSASMGTIYSASMEYNLTEYLLPTSSYYYTYSR